jgi:insulysin
MTTEIEKSPNDKSEYKSIRLTNNLEAVLIYDKDTDVSAATLSVGVGNYSDPVEYLGLAHFLEHMLFMGTKKYPDVNHYQEFINNHGGSSNAYTTDERTCYFYSIQNDFMKEALDIFGHFFIDPLFDESTINKEIEAVDSEHSKNINSDNWRFDRIIKKVSRQEHPYSKFSTGTLETLKHKNIRDIMMKFYREHYSSNIMKLSVISNKPLNELEIIVRDIFSQVKNTDYKSSSYPGKPHNFKEVTKDAVCYKLIKKVPVMDQDSLKIIWQLPDTRKNYQYKPDNYIGNLLGHESDGSLICYLRDKSWATSIQSGILGTDMSASIFILAIELTSTGFKNIPAIIDTIYYYIDIMLQQGVDEWRYNEIKTISKLNFKYLPKINASDRSLSVSENMLIYPIKHCISAPYLYEDYSERTEDLIKQHLQYFKRDKSIVVIDSRSYNDIAIKKEKYYGIQYLDRVNPTVYGSEFTLDKDSNLNTTNIHLPIKNIFIPKKITLNKAIVSKETKYPIRIKQENDNMSVWFKQDDKFKSPKVLISTMLYNSELSNTIKNYTMFNLFFRIFNYSLTSISYYSNVAGINFGVSMNYEYLNIIVNSYNNTDTLNKVFKILINQFSSPICKKMFDLVKSDYKRDLHNFIYKTPTSLALEYLKENTLVRYYTFKEILKELDNITDKDVLVSSVNKILKNKCKIKSFIYGNILQKDGDTIPSHFTTFLSKDPQLKNFMPILTVTELKPGEHPVYSKDVYNPKERDSAIKMFYEIGYIKKSRDDKEWTTKHALIMLINSMTREKFFTQLRSVEQSGYIVKSEILGLGSIEKTIFGLLFYIQSYKKTPEKLEKRITLFMEETLKFIKKLDNKLLDKYKNMLITSLNKKDDNMYEQFDRYLSEIKTGSYMFNFKKYLIPVIKEVSTDQLVLFFDEYFVNNSTKKVRTVKIYSKNQKKIDK